MLVLVMTVILGVVAAALAGYAATGLRTSTVTDRRTERAAAVDAGMRVGVELLKNDPSACSGAVTINGIPVTIACTPVTDPARLGPYRITATATDRGVTTTGVADVQAYTASGKVCGAVAGERCTVMINAWAVR